MKKFLPLFFLLICVPMSFAQKDSRLFIHPGRETFVYFPSDSLQNKYTVTFFLPEQWVPLSRNYPVVVALGVTPQEAAQVTRFQQRNPVIVVGINFEEKDYEQKAAQIVQFLTHELFPYVDSNYLTLSGSEHRILAVRGKAAAQVALQVMQKKNLFGALALFSPGEISEEEILPYQRVLVVGNQTELYAAQTAFEHQNKQYGPDFALRYFAQTGAWFEMIDTAYLWAPVEQLSLQYMKAAVWQDILPADGSQETFMRVWAVLANNSIFNYIPHQLRFSPPVLEWDPQYAVLRVIPGAQPGTVRVRNVVDNPFFSVKIKLKK